MKRKCASVIAPEADDIEARVTDEDRDTLPTEDTSEACDVPVRNRVGVSPPSAEALCPDWDHLGG